MKERLREREREIEEREREIEERARESKIEKERAREK